ncbi:uncharacterized protein HD556DRAFT_1310846 [Suillus plorans]|uniref:Uncharacterized protein n=1 Tax=Suillus plorans TaxID=116603 RepID=A0A9P7AIG8_9AGAM|nr:uncharacterized protein HD556DRAFT_1310846 [Suillus plorans]KAG1790047.1 hypothetical protein HD556DRAFT_1310846 [Suillus plorans]
MQTSFHNSSITLPAQTIHTSPPGPGWPKGQQDAVLVNVEGGSVWPESGLTGHAICELHLIMRPTPRRGSHITWKDQYLCYVQVLTIGSVDPATEMIILKCVKHTDGTPVGNIVPLCQLRSFISLIPRLGDVADVNLCAEKTNVQLCGSKQFSEGPSSVVSVMTSASTSFMLNYLLATVTTSIPASGNFTHRKQDYMDELMKHELLVGPDNNLMGSKRVLWEEGIQGCTLSILDILIPRSSLKIQDIHKIKYIKKKDNYIIHGLSVLPNPRSITSQWRLTHAFDGPLKKTKWNQQESQIDTEEEEEEKEEADGSLSVGKDMLEMDGSWLQRSYQTGEKHPILAIKALEEKNLERLFRSVCYDMRNKVKSKMGSLPFHVLPEPRYWSSEFSNIAVPDATDSRKPDLVLMDYRLQKCSRKEKSWADVLTGVEITISELAEGKGIPIFLGVATKGYLIMCKQLWHHLVLLFSIANFKLHAHYLDRSGMIISAPMPIGRDAVHFADVLNMEATLLLVLIPPFMFDNDGQEYVLKDCWVDEDKLEQEVNFLRAVDGVPNVVRLRKHWDIKYDGCVDSTAHICDHSWSMFFVTLLLILVTHKTITTQRKVLHGDLSPNNLIIFKGKGYFIDFDHAKFIQFINQAKNSRGTGGAPKNSRRWHKAYVAMDKDGLGTSGSLKKEFLMDTALHYEPAPYF